MLANNGRVISPASLILSVSGRAAFLLNPNFSILPEGLFGKSVE